MSPVDSATIKQRFPALAARPEVAYLDSASTTQKPASVVAAVQRYLTDGTANAGRGTYPWPIGSPARWTMSASGWPGSSARPDRMRSSSPPEPPRR
jgi:hypothetical protein